MLIAYLFYSGYHYKDKYWGHFSLRYAKAVKAKVDAINLDQNQEKDKTKCKIFNTDIVDDFNIHYDHYIIRHSDLLNRSDVCYSPKFGDYPYKDMCFAAKDYSRSFIYR